MSFARRLLAGLCLAALVGVVIGCGQTPPQEPQPAPPLPVKDVTSDDIGIDSNLVGPLDIEREGDRSLDAVITKDDHPAFNPRDDATLPPGLQEQIIADINITAEYLGQRAAELTRVRAK